VNTLDLQAVSKSFGFLVPPVVDLKVGAAKMNEGSASKQRHFKQVNRDQAKKFTR